MISDETAKEGAKAVQESAKATVTLAELAGKAGAFVAKVIGGPMEQVGEMLTDRMRLFKYKNLCAVIDRAEEINRQRKLDGKTIQIPPRLAIPMLEAAALEDDETLQDIWAGLIANAMNPEATIVIHPAFLEVARQLTSDEAIILSMCEKESAVQMRFVPIKPDLMAINTPPVLEILGRNAPDGVSRALVLKMPQLVWIYFDNLLRLQLIEKGEWDNGFFNLTAFGANFIKACSQD